MWKPWKRQHWNFLISMEPLNIWFFQNSLPKEPPCSVRQTGTIPGQESLGVRTWAPAGFHMMEDGPHAKRQKGCSPKEKSSLSKIVWEMPDELTPLQWLTSVNMTNINWTNQWSQLIVEQGRKHQHLVHNGARSCPMDVGEEQQLCSGAVHLLLFQNSLCRELLAEAGVHRPGWGWGIPACPIQFNVDPQRDNTVLEPWASPCACHPQVTAGTLASTWWPQGRRCSSVVPLHPCWRSTPRGTSQPVLQSSQLLCPPHPACAFTTNASSFPAGSFSWGMATEKDQLDLKCQQSIQVDPEVWVNDLKNLCLQIWCFTGSAKFDSYCWWHSQLMAANWGGTKLCLWRAALSLSWQEPAGPGEHWDIEFCSSLTLTLICTTCLVWLYSHLSQLHKQVFVQKQHMSHGHSCEKPLFR